MQDHHTTDTYTVQIYIQKFISIPSKNIYVYIYVCIYIYIYMYTHTQKKMCRLLRRLHRKAEMVPVSQLKQTNPAHSSIIMTKLVNSWFVRDWFYFCAAPELTHRCRNACHSRVVTPSPRTRFYINRASTHHFLSGETAALLHPDKPTVCKKTHSLNTFLKWSWWALL